MSVLCLNNSRLTTINVEGCGLLSDRFLEAVVKYTPYIVNLFVGDNRNYSDAGIAVVAQRSTSLHTLSISRCRHIEENTQSSRKKK